MKNYLTLTLLLVSCFGFSQTTIFDVAGGGASLPTGWVGNNNVATTAITQAGNSYFLLEAGATSDNIVTGSIDLSVYSSAVFTLNFAPHTTSGTLFATKIEISYNGGSSYAQLNLTQLPLTAITYLSSGPITLTGTLTNDIKIRIANNATGSGRGIRLQALKLVAYKPWNLDGNQVAAVKSLGTTDNFDLPIITNNTEKVRIMAGGNVGIGLTNPTYKLDVTGNLRTTLDANINGVAVGKGTNNITTNTALGYNALNVATGSNNTAIGYIAGSNITTGNENTSVGYQAMIGTVGHGAVALGAFALQNWVSGNFNVAVGYDALHGSGTGAGNIGIGRNVMGGAVTGNYNVGLGYTSLSALTSGVNNVAIGLNAGNNLTTGSNNILIGASVAASTVSVNNELNIGNWIYGASGNIGIATSTPTEKLDVNGNVRFSGALMPNNTAGTAGQVLTSAGAGASPTWTTSGAGSNGWAVTGNAGTVPGTNFIGTTDAQPLVFKTNSLENFRINANGSITHKTTGGSGNTAYFLDDNYYGAWVSINTQSANPSTGSGLRMRVNDAVKSQIFYNEGAFSFGTTVDGIAGNTDLLSRTGDVYLSTGTFKSNGLIVKNGSGNVGIGTTSPSEKLDVAGNIYTNGKILIGQANTAAVAPYALAVNGIAIFTKAVVKLNSNWPDYVFEPDYGLLPITQLEKYIQQNKHLPNIPSAEQVKKEGIDLGNSQTLQLQKIEELTLYIIDLNKKIESLQKDNIEIRKQLNQKEQKK